MLQSYRPRETTTRWCWNPVLTGDILLYNFFSKTKPYTEQRQRVSTYWQHSVYVIFNSQILLIPSNQEQSCDLWISSQTQWAENGVVIIRRSAARHGQPRTELCRFKKQRPHVVVKPAELQQRLSWGIMISLGSETFWTGCNIIKVHKWHFQMTEVSLYIAHCTNINAVGHPFKVGNDYGNPHAEMSAYNEIPLTPAYSALVWYHCFWKRIVARARSSEAGHTCVAGHGYHTWAGGHGYYTSETGHRYHTCKAFHG